MSLLFSPWHAASDGGQRQQLQGRRREGAGGRDERGNGRIVDAARGLRLEEHQRQREPADAWRRHFRRERYNLGLAKAVKSLPLNEDQTDLRVGFYILHTRY